MLIYNKLGLFDRIYPEEIITNRRTIYKIKWNTIKNCIYAVDIENSAVDITKLRLWLSIVVDQIHVPKTGPEPLPNLDCKIMQGNSLIDEFNGIKLIDEELIEKSKEEFVIKAEGKKNIENQMRFLDSTPEFAQLGFYTDEKRTLINSLIKTKNQLFGTNISEEKKRLLNLIKGYREALFKVNFRSSGANSLEELLKADKGHNKPYFSWKLEFIEVFVENGGFDVVIGNPPYVSAVSNTTSEDQKEQRDIIRKLYPEVSGAFDLYVPFLLMALNLSNKKGVYSFIIPNKLLVSNYAEESLKKLKKNGLYNVLSLSHIKVFDTASVYPIIINGNKSKNEFNEYNVEKLSNLLKGEFERKRKLKIEKNFKEEGIKIASGATGFQAKSLVEDINIINESGTIPFVVSGCIDKYVIKYENVRYMGQTYPRAFITKGLNTADSKWKFWNNPKIIVAGMTKVVEAVWIDEPVGLGVGIYGIYDFAGHSPYFILAILNSKYISYYLNVEFEEKHLAGGYLAINKTTLEQLPFANVDEKTEDEIAELTQKMQDKKYSLEEKKKIQDLIEKKIYNIYGLNEQEITNVEEYYKNKELWKFGW